MRQGREEEGWMERGVWRYMQNVREAKQYRVCVFVQKRRKNAYILKA